MMGRRDPHFLREQAVAARYCIGGKTSTPELGGCSVLMVSTFSPERGKTIIRHVAKGSRGNADSQTRYGCPVKNRRITNFEELKIL